MNLFQIEGKKYWGVAQKYFSLNRPDILNFDILQRSSTNGTCLVCYHEQYSDYTLRHEE